MLVLVGEMPALLLFLMDMVDSKTDSTVRLLKARSYLLKYFEIVQDISSNIRYSLLKGWQ
jgi:hypothetical protein